MKCYSYYDNYYNDHRNPDRDLKGYKKEPDEPHVDWLILDVPGIPSYYRDRFHIWRNANTSSGEEKITVQYMDEENPKYMVKPQYENTLTEVEFSDIPVPQWFIKVLILFAFGEEDQADTIKKEHDVNVDHTSTKDLYAKRS